MKPKHSSPCSENHTLKQLNANHKTTLHSFKAHFHITFPSTTKSPKKSLCLKSIPTKILSSSIMTAISLLSIIWTLHFFFTSFLIQSTHPIISFLHSNLFIVLMFKLSKEFIFINIQHIFVSLILN